MGVQQQQQHTTPAARRIINTTPITTTTRKTSAVNTTNENLYQTPVERPNGRTPWAPVRSSFVSSSAARGGPGGTGAAPERGCSGGGANGGAGTGGTGVRDGLMCTTSAAVHGSGYLHRGSGFASTRTRGAERERSTKMKAGERKRERRSFGGGSGGSGAGTGGYGGGGAAGEDKRGRRVRRQIDILAAAGDNGTGSVVVGAANGDTSANGGSKQLAMEPTAFSSPFKTPLKPSQEMNIQNNAIAAAATCDQPMVTASVLVSSHLDGGGGGAAETCSFASPREMDICVDRWISRNRGSDDDDGDEKRHAADPPLDDASERFKSPGLSAPMHKMGLSDTTQLDLRLRFVDSSSLDRVSGPPAPPM